MADQFDDMIDGKDLEPSHKTQKGAFYAIIVIVSLIYVMIGIDTLKYQGQIQVEVNSLQKITGETEFTKVMERTERWYKAVMVESGGQAMLARLFARERKDAKVKFGFKYISDRLANNIPFIAYQGAFRLSSFTLWVWLLLPFVAASIIDAVNMWRAKIYGFGQMQLRKFHMWRGLMAYLVVMVLAFFLVPAIAGEYTVFIPPAVLLITTFLITRWIKEYQIQL